VALLAAVCNRFPFLVIQRTDAPAIEFRDGLFETEDAEVWAELQKHAFWGVHIHPREHAEPAPPPAAEPTVRRGAVGTRAGRGESE
jgi:hypothetical protein